MARTVEDILARRLRLLFLDADAAIKSAPIVAKLMAAEMNYGPAWEDAQVGNFNLLAAKYLIAPIA
jgi:glycerol-3-phosphate dehydrogenase